VPVADQLGRRLGALRISVTDRCNLRCHYCMPEEEYVWLPRHDILSFEEIARLARVFVGLGVTKVRLTGGEPLLRRDLPDLVRRLSGTPGVDDLALTTNGVLLRDQARGLREAGLHRITVSLDTLDPERFRAIARMDELPRVQDGLAAAVAQFPLVKIDSVIIRGLNDDEMPALLAYARTLGAEVRFIEYMDVGGATRWSMSQVVPRTEMLARLTAAYGPATPIVENTSAPADRFELADGTTFGIIASTTTPFCRSCDRSRLTADGLWFLCLYARHGTDVRALLRSGASDADIAERLASTWQARTDRGAEVRAAERERTPFIPVSRLRREPHLEMHTRGG
jgi:GTP 3',8-cyclase